MRKLLAFLILILLVSGCSKSEKSYSKSIPLMGTFVRIKIFDSSNEPVNPTITKMKNLSEEFDYFNKDSELNKINNSPNKLDGIIVSRDMGKVLEISFKLNKITNGAFDITIPPLMRVWNLYGKKISEIPKKYEIIEALRYVGMDKIAYDEINKVIKFKDEKIELDFSAIAKGYIVDNAAMELRRRGITNAIIDAGGDMFCLGDKNRKEWVIGIRDAKEKNKIAGKIKIENKAIATSGGYENFITIDGITYPHIIDPRTGYPAKNNILSVTVISDSCALSDGLATALFVLGPEEGFELIKKLNKVDCIIIYEDKGKVKYLISDGIVKSVEIL